MRSFEDFLHLAVARVREKASVAQCTRSELHAALEPPEDFAVGECPCGFARHGCARELFVRQILGSCRGNTALGAVAGAEIGVTHRVASRLRSACDAGRRAPSLELPPASLAAGWIKSSSNGLSRRIRPFITELMSDTTREAQAFLTGTFFQIDEDVQHGLFERLWYARGDVVVTLGDLLRHGCRGGPKTLVIFAGYSRCFAR